MSVVARRVFRPHSWVAPATGHQRLERLSAARAPCPGRDRNQGQDTARVGQGAGPPVSWTTGSDEECHHRTAQQEARPSAHAGNGKPSRHELLRSRPSARAPRRISAAPQLPAGFGSLAQSSSAIRTCRSTMAHISVNCHPYGPSTRRRTVPPAAHQFHRLLLANRRVVAFPDEASDL